MKKAIILKITIFLLAFLFLGSASIFAQPNGFIIKGKIVGAKNGEKVYLIKISNSEYLDSTLINNEIFTMRGWVKEPTHAWVNYLREYANIIIENLPISFEAPTTKWLISTKILGGKEQELQNKLKEIELPFNTAYLLGMDSLNKALFTNKEHQSDISKRINTMSDQNQEKYIAFGKKNPNSFLGLDILYRNRQTIGKSEMAVLLKKMSPRIRNSSTGKTLDLFLASELIKEGQYFSDFTANTIDNEKFTLSSLRGQYIYLTFWESGCGPCRLENRLFAKEMDRIKGRLQIVSFSLNSLVTTWRNASNIDGITWHNISDLKGNDSPIKIKYNVQSIPHSFLIDKEGKIIKIFSGFSKNIVEELLGLVK